MEEAAYREKQSCLARPLARYYGVMTREVLDSFTGEASGVGYLGFFWMKNFRGGLFLVSGWAHSLLLSFSLSCKRMRPHAFHHPRSPR